MGMSLSIGTLRDDIQSELGGFNTEEQNVFMLATCFFTDNVPGYAPSNLHELCLVMFCGGEDWRAHKKKEVPELPEGHKKNGIPEILRRLQVTGVGSPSATRQRSSRVCKKT